MGRAIIDVVREPTFNYSAIRRGVRFQYEGITDFGSLWTVADVRTMEGAALPTAQHPTDLVALARDAPRRDRSIQARQLRYDQRWLLLRRLVRHVDVQ